MQVTGNPFAAWTVENPSRSNNYVSQWKITESRNGMDRVFLDVFNSGSGSWQLSAPGNDRPDELSVVSGGDIRTETTFVRPPGSERAQVEFERIINGHDLTGVNYLEQGG